MMKIFLEILIIIEYIHSKGYVYRDLKPDNFIKFYEFFISKIPEVKETEMKKSNSDIHNDLFGFYWYLIAEYQNPKSLFILGLIFEYGLFIWKDNDDNKEF